MAGQGSQPPPVSSETTLLGRIASESGMRRFYPSVYLGIVVMSVLWGSALAQDASKQAPAASSSAVSSSANTASSTSASPGATAIDENPVTVKTTSDSNSKKPVDTDPVFGVPPLPKGKTTLVGGTVANIDGVHNRLGVKVFKGGKWTIAFDERTHFYIDGAETTFEKVKKGERVYVDTMLDGYKIFARNVHIVTKTGPASASGQVVEFNNGMMTVRDELSARPVEFRVDGQTQVKRNGESASLSEIQPGSLISVQFAAGGNDLRGTAREVTIMAAPGQSVTFYGKVMNVDLRNNQLSVENHTDNKTYEIAVDGEKSIPSNLMVGSEVTVAAVFDGKGYRARSISVTQPVASSQ